jgi:hypothetical protein
MKKLTAFKINENVTVDEIINFIQDESNKFHDYQTPLQLQAVGFTKFNDDSINDFVEISNLLAIRYKIKEKVLPKNEIKEKVKEEVKRIKEQEKRNVSKKEEKSIKEQITNEIVKHAFSKTSYVEIYFDFNRHIMFIDQTSEKKYEQIFGAFLKSYDDEDMIRVELLPQKIVSEKPFGSTIKQLIIEKWFDSDENNTEIVPTNKLTLEFIDDSEDGKTQTISFKNINARSEDIIQAAIKGNRFVASAEFMLGEYTLFTLNEHLDIVSIKNAKLKAKFNPQEESLEEFLQAQLIIEVNTINAIYEQITSILANPDE